MLMTMDPLTGFDDWLNRLLVEQAAGAGETVDAYVARAVAARLMSDVAQQDEQKRLDLLMHLSTVAVPAWEKPSGPAVVVADPERLRALEATGLLDSEPEQAYDRIVGLAAEALSTPTAALSLVDRDRQFFKSQFGLVGEVAEARGTPIERSICQYAVAAGEPLVVEDARIDPVLKDHPVVVDGDLVSYLGIPLIDSGGHAIGTLCVWDAQPRQWSVGHVHILQDLARLAADRIFLSTANS
jgi:GAF domain-containing protein